AGSAPSVILPVIVRGLSLCAMLDGANGYEGQADELRLFEIPASGFDVTRHLLANAQPSVSLDRIALDFGNVEPAAWTTRSFTLANTGPGWLRVVSMELIGDGASDYRVYAVGSSSGAMPIQPDPTPFPVYPSSGWSWSNWYGTINNVSVGTLSYTALPAFIGMGTSIAYRAAIAPQTKVEAYVYHAASTLGQRPATLRITTNDASHPVYEIALNATTVAAPATVSQPQFSVQRIRDIGGERLYTNDDSWDWGTLLPNGLSNCIFGVNFAPEFSLLRAAQFGSAAQPSFSVEIIGPNAEDVTFSTSASLPSLASAKGNGGQALTLTSFFSTYIHLTVRPRAAGARYAALRITPDDPERPEIIIPIYGRGVQTAPEIAVTLWGNPPSSLVRTLVANGGRSEFAPALSGGHSADLSCSIHNIGNAQLDGISMSIDGPDAADFTVIGTLPTNISPYNNSAQIQLRFTPSRVGTHTATLHILSNDADESPYDITLTGEGLTSAPIMQVIDRDTVIESGAGFTRMGNAVIGAAPVTQTLRLRNAGTALLTGITASFSGSNASEFSATLPSPIAAGTTGDVIIAFTPEDIGPRSAVLTLTSNDPNNRTYRMSLGGTGAYGVRSNLAPPAIPGWVGTAMAELPDGSIVMAGYVAAGAGETAPAVPTSRLRIIGKDGSERKQARLQHMTISGVVKSICVRADGSLLLAGDFTRLWGSLRPSMVTTGWMPPLGYDPRPFIDCQGVALILSETAWMPAQIGDALLTISSGGQDQAYPLAWNSSFKPPTGTFSGRSVVALPDGKVLIGGSGSLGGRANLIRLNANGTIDPTFTLPEPNGPVNALAMQDDGKVIVGGEFTNLGHDKLATETEAVSRFPSSTTPRTGLARLNADGSDDATFANRGFHQVMSLAARGDCIAVGGVEKQYSTLNISYTSSSTAPLGYGEFDQAVASLLGRDGAILATQPVREIPQAVALQPGNRMLFASRFWSLIDLITHPSVALLQPTSAPTEWLGVSIASDVLPATTSEHFLINYQKLLPAGDGFRAINAIIAQADGKMLVAGDFSRASVSRDPRGYRSDGSQFPPQPTSLLPVLDNSPLPAETPLAGFAQLDVDGFYHASPVVYAGRGIHWVGDPYETDETTMSDGLRRIDFGTFHGNLLAIDHWLIVPTSSATNLGAITIDGDDAADFGFTPASEGSNHLWLLFTPSHSGKHQARLHVPEDGLVNSFDIALEATATGRLPDQVRLADTTGRVYQSTETRDLGSVTLGSSTTLDLRLFNDGLGANSTPLELSLSGINASDFKVSPTAIISIPGSSRNGAGSVPITVTFTPNDSGPRTAVLNLFTISRGRNGDIRSIPFTLTLTGAGLVESPFFTSQPQDVIVMKGTPFNLSFEAIYKNRGFEFEWHQQQGSRDRVLRKSLSINSGSPSTAVHKSSDTFAVAKADSTTAGIYHVVIRNEDGTANSRRASVGVVEVVNREVTTTMGGNAAFGVSVNGPPMPLGSSAFVYQWLFKGEPLTNSANVNGANGPNIRLTQVTADQEGAYTCQITLGTKTLTTPLIQLQVVSKPQIASIPDLNWQVGRPVNFQIQAMQKNLRFSIKGLPSGVNVNAVTGQLSGRPTRAGNYTLRVQVENAAGSSSMTANVVVLPLPEDVFGSFFGTIYRNPEFNDGLGGTWSLTVTTTGAYSAKLNLATSELSGKKKGKMKTLTLSGIILPKGDWAETMPVSLPHPTGGAALQVSFRLTAKTVVNGEDQHTAAILFL
ncbi:MAG: choice-of-anchor D domain-containing protein, partial [Verrucomicrobia bacterium]|nr:choice-of-anchor D domain-containing protein [Verrucomicrobiota bacterium]